MLCAEDLTLLIGFENLSVLKPEKRVQSFKTCFEGRFLISLSFGSWHLVLEVS